LIGVLLSLLGPDLDEVRQFRSQRKAGDRVFIDGLHRVKDKQAAQQDNKSKDFGIMILILLKGATTLCVKKDNVHISILDPNGLSPYPYSLRATLGRWANLETSLMLIQE
jgi:hypothetical protein